MTATEAEAGTPLADWLDEHGDGLIAVRRNIHAHPELSGEEYATTELVAERLEVAGLTTTRLSSGTGLICDLDGAEIPSLPRIALRGDLDALGMDDEKDVPYRSQVPGVSHACGHDVHTTIVLGVGLFYARHPELIPGPIRLIFQPAEERVPGGALDVLADDGLGGIGAIFGFHCDPKLDVGLIGLKSGPISSAADMARIVLSGPGGHTARPDETVDMVTLAARIVHELPVRVDRACGGSDGDQKVRLVFGALHSGDAANVVPAHAELRASVRTPELHIWESLSDVVRTELEAIVAGTGAELELDYTHGVPPVVNDAEVVDLIRGAADTELGAAAITPAIQSWGGDDFAWFTREVPGAYVRLGVHDPASNGPKLDLHAGRFDADERSIDVGVRLAVAAIARYFEASA